MMRTFSSRSFLALLCAISVVGLTVLATGCSSETECASDGECPEDYECVSAGGLFAADAVCLPKDGDDTDLDAGVNDVEDAEDDTDEPSICDDGEQSGDQTDIDCGGSECPPCEVGKNCEADTDCITLHCDEGTCEESDDDCPSGEVECNDDCVDITSDFDHCGGCDDGCEGDEICDGGLCVCEDECCSDDDCDGSRECSGGSCVCNDDCCSDDECTGTAVCEDGECECPDECCSDAECPGFEQCQSGSCVCNDGTCCSGDDCSGDDECSHRNECIDPSGIDCDDSCDCPVGWTCGGSNCHAVPLMDSIPRCCVDPQCESGEACTELDGSDGTCD